MDGPSAVTGKNLDAETPAEQGDYFGCEDSLCSSWGAAGVSLQHAKAPPLSNLEDEDSEKPKKPLVDPYVGAR